MIDSADLLGQTQCDTFSFFERPLNIHCCCCQAEFPVNWIVGVKYFTTKASSKDAQMVKNIRPMSLVSQALSYYKSPLSFTVLLIRKI